MGYCSSQSKTSYTNWVDNCTNTATIASSDYFDYAANLASGVSCPTLTKDNVKFCTE